MARREARGVFISLALPCALPPHSSPRTVVSPLGRFRFRFILAIPFFSRLLFCASSNARELSSQSLPFTGALQCSRSSAKVRQPRARGARGDEEQRTVCHAHRMACLHTFLHFASAQSRFTGLLETACLATDEGSPCSSRCGRRCTAGLRLHIILPGIQWPVTVERRFSSSVTNFSFLLQFFHLFRSWDAGSDTAP